VRHASIYRAPAADHDSGTVGRGDPRFFLMYMLPGDPASTILAQSGGKAESVEKLREQLGLNDPLPVQYGRF